MDETNEIDLTAADFGDFYDELPLWSAPFGLMLLDRVPVRAGQTILDVGAGTGFLSLELAERCGPSTTVIAVDPWAAGTARLKRKRDRLGLGNVRLVERDAAQLDLEDASVDLVVSNLGINNFEDPEAVLKTCRQAMKPEAQLFLTTNLAGHMREFYEIYELTLVELGLSERLAALEAHIAHRGSVESVTQLLARCGFETVSVGTEVFRLRYADGSTLLRHHFIRLGFVPAWKAVAPEGRAEQVFAELEKRLNALAAERGELSLTIPVACFEARRAR